MTNSKTVRGLLSCLLSGQSSAPKRRMSLETSRRCRTMPVWATGDSSVSVDRRGDWTRVPAAAIAFSAVATARTIYEFHREGARWCFRQIPRSAGARAS
jgi:hypothetical protein